MTRKPQQPSHQPVVRVELRWLMPRALPLAVAMCFGHVWCPIPLYVREGRLYG